MAARKMTFTLPEEIAERLVRQIPARDRSRYVGEAIGAKLRERALRLERACKVANADPDVTAVEQEWDALPDDIQEPWIDAPAR